MTRPASVRFFFLWIVAATPFLCGCAVFDTLEGVEYLIEPETGARYYLYLPTTFEPSRSWPLIVTCHGTPPWDTASLQIRAWKRLAERKRTIVVAPELVGTRGDLPPPPAIQIERQRRDERTILAVVNHVRGARHVAADRIFLTGWSAGGYAVLFTGLRNPRVFRALSVRQGNFDERYLKPVLGSLDPFQPIHILYGSTDPLKSQAQACVEWLRAQRMFVSEDPTTGTHKRHQQETYAFFMRCVKRYPWVTLRAAQVSPDRPLTVKFLVTASPSARTYRWRFGDGTRSKVASPEHTFKAAGTYDVEVLLDIGRKELQRRLVTVTVPRRRVGTTSRPAR